MLAFLLLCIYRLPTYLDRSINQVFINHLYCIVQHVDKTLEAELENNRTEEVQEEIGATTEGSKKMDELRERIANDMWRQYQFLLDARNRYN